MSRRLEVFRFGEMYATCGFDARLPKHRNRHSHVGCRDTAKVAVNAADAGLASPLWTPAKALILNDDLHHAAGVWDGHVCGNLGACESQRANQADHSNLNHGLH